MIINWSASPEIFQYEFLRIRWYGLMFVMGFSLGYYFMTKISQWENKPLEPLGSLLNYLVIGTAVGARLGHCLFYDPIHYLSNPLEILKIWEGGLASHGGGLGVIVALFLFSRKYSDFSLIWLLDRISVFTVMTGAFIRIGNLMNSEILGKPTDGSWGFIFNRVDNIPRHPAMLYESFAYAVIFLVAYVGLYLPKKAKVAPGKLFGFVVASLMASRFMIEFFKEVQSPFEQDWPINMGQILSLPFIAFGLYLFFRKSTPASKKN